MIINRSPANAHIASEGAGRFRIEGDIGFYSVMHLLQEGRELFKHEERVRLDFSGVEKINSSGLALIIEWMKDASRESRALEISNLPFEFLAMTHICNVDDLIESVLQPHEKSEK